METGREGKIVVNLGEALGDEEKGREGKEREVKANRLVRRYMRNDGRSNEKIKDRRNECEGGVIKMKD